MTRATCNRCLRLAPRKGRMSASIVRPNGRRERRFLCRVCIAELGGRV